MKKYINNGFTLIELLVVIAVLGVLASGVFIAIDPLDKTNAGNDATIQNHVNQVGRSMETYAVTHNTSYPESLTLLKTSGDLKNIPAQPTNYNAYVLGCTTAPCSSQTFCGQLKSKKYVNATPSKPAFVWCSSTGKVGPTTACNVCP